MYVIADSIGPVVAVHASHCRVSEKLLAVVYSQLSSVRFLMKKLQRPTRDMHENGNLQKRASFVSESK